MKDIPVTTSAEASLSHLAPEANQDEPEDDIENEDDSEDNSDGVYVSVSLACVLDVSVFLCGCRYEFLGMRIVNDITN